MFTARAAECPCPRAGSGLKTISQWNDWRVALPASRPFWHPLYTGGFCVDLICVSCAIISVIGCCVSAFTVITRWVIPASSSVSMTYPIKGFPQSGSSCLQQPMRVDSPPARRIAVGSLMGLPVLLFSDTVEIVCILLGIICYRLELRFSQYLKMMQNFALAQAVHTVLLYFA